MKYFSQSLGEFFKSNHLIMYQSLRAMKELVIGLPIKMQGFHLDRIPLSHRIRVEVGV